MTSAPPVFTPHTADTWHDPFPLYRALRDAGPVHRADPLPGEELEYYVLPRHADVWEALRDPGTFSSAQASPCTTAIWRRSACRTTRRW